MIFFICFGYVFSVLQAPVQAFLRPGLWFPGLRALHRQRQRWLINADTATGFNQISEGLNRLKAWSLKTYGNHEMKIYKVDDEKMFFQLHFLTPMMQWLDVVEIEVRPGQFSGTEVWAHSFSTGLFPICLPLAFLVNMVLFFFPFYDWGMNRDRLNKICIFSKIEPDQVETLANC